MITKPKTMRCGPGPNRRTRLLAIVGVMLMLAGTTAIGGCARNKGRLTRSPEVGVAFEEGRPYPGYRYYYSGREDMPYAIIGIDKAYQVTSKLWKAFLPTNAKLRRMATFIFDDVNAQPYGAFILNPAGERIGVWYSQVFFVNVRVDQANKTIDVLFKNPELESGGGKYFSSDG